MNDVICPACGKPNSDKVEICQYCGTALKRSATEPLAPIHPGDMPVKRKTSDLERTLPGWLRDARKASGEEADTPELHFPSTPASPVSPASSSPSVQPAKPETPRKKEPVSPLDFLAGLSQVNDEEEETPDWLKGLQDSIPGAAAPLQDPTPAVQGQPEAETQPEQPVQETPNWGFGAESNAFNFDDSAEPAQAATEETPDWLNQLKAQDESARPTSVSKPTASQPAAELPATGDLPDWLSALTGGTSARPEPAPSDPQPAASADTPDWLSGLSGDFTAEEGAPSTEPDSETQAPDWLSRMDEPGDFPASSAPAAQPAEDIPDWMKDLQASSPVSAAPPETSAPVTLPADDLPDWMAGLQDTSPATPSEFPASVVRPAEDIPDWMKDLQASSPVSAASPETSAPVTLPADDLPDWMADLQDATQAAPSESSLPATLPTGDLPDWMAGLQDATPAAPSETPVPTALPGDDLPDWMAGLQDVTPAVPSEPSASAEPSTDDLPDWMASLQGTSPVAPSETPVSTVPPADDLPDWMASLQDASPAAPTELPASVALPADDMPDWMTGLGQPVSAAPADNASVTHEPFDTSGSPLADLPGSDDMPDWLSGISAGAAASAAFEEPEPTVPPIEAASAPLETSPATAPAEQNIDSIFSMEMPDWLSSFTPSDAEKKSALEDSNAEDANLRPAELPSWVQAMRPMESVMADAGDGDEDQQVENQGPLAGLRSVLPVQSGMQDVYSSKPYALKLLATETQQAQAALLDNLLNSESTPQKLPKRADSLSIRPLRWIIAVLMFLAVLVPAVIGTRIFPVPPPPAESSPAAAFISVVKGLSSSSPVLMVVDYQPGFAGELEPAAGPVITQLSEKNIPMAFISTSPVGPYMAERLVKKYASNYQLNTGYVNLGYLPGGAGGIKAFAEQPAATVGQDFNLGDMWAQPAMAGATVNSAISLANFGAVIVLTDNPDTGRLWIEQASASLNKSPMLMVVSAQAEPMIRPYMLSGQLRGMVAGLEGGVIYESQQANESKNGPRTYWDAFGMGMIIAELLILIGGIWGLIAGLRARRTVTEQDEA